MKLSLELAFAVILVAVVGYLVWPRSGQQVRPEEARRLVQEGALLLDVRTAQEFSAGHLPGARNIPVQELEARWSEVGDPAAPVVVYCRSGARSARAKELLKQRGFANVSDLGAMARY